MWLARGSSPVRGELVRGGVILGTVMGPRAVKGLSLEEALVAGFLRSFPQDSWSLFGVRSGKAND